MYSLAMIDPEMRDYAQYQFDVTDDIHACIESLSCQPILFIGSGLVKRYANGPNWEELLKEMAKNCPAIKMPYAYYSQKYSTPEEIGTQFTEFYNDWAWSSGRSFFPDELFLENVKPDIYFKVKVAELFKSLKMENKKHFDTEIRSLQEIHPHAIITTNYDSIISEIFPEYETVIGEKILRQSHSSIGELYKIHGCITQPETIVINTNDYDIFRKKKKYLSAKLLTYFIEHPLLFIGYSINDSNIREILSDIDEILSDNGELIPNIYFIDFSKEINPQEYPAREVIITTESNKNIRVKSIKTNSFEWIFDAFKPSSPLDKVNPKLLRSLLARAYKLVRSDIPKNPLQLDYSVFESAANDDGALAKIFGIIDASDSNAFNANYPYILSTLGKIMGFKSWHGPNDLLQKIREATGVDLKTFDSKYHYAIMNGEHLHQHRYSKAMLLLLEKVQKGEKFDLDIPENISPH